MTFSQLITIAKPIGNKINEYLNTPGPELYLKYGLKADETVTYTACFKNGYTMDIKMVVCDVDKPYIDFVLFDKHGCERACDTGDDEFEGIYELSDGKDDYVVTVAFIDVAVENDKVSQNSFIEYIGG